MQPAGTRRAWRVYGAILAVVLMMASESGSNAQSGAQRVTVEKVNCVNLPNCYKLTNGTVELVVTTDIGPRVMRYAFVGGENILGEIPGSTADKDRNTWQSWGGHRLW